jgi:hypothetical protein
METTIARPKQPHSHRNVPDYLVKEMLNGIPIYYKGYQSVLKNKKTSEDIMGASGLQIFIISYLNRLLYRHLNEKLYHIFSGEGGVHIDKGNNVSGDVMIYRKINLLSNMIDTHYLNIAPLIDIEIDVNIDNSTYTDFEYIYQKTKKMLDFGTMKMIWILTKTQQVIVAEPQKDWLVIDWTKDIEIIDGLTFNVPAYLAQEGVVIK